MIRTLPLVAALALGATALPAQASSQKNLENCKAQLVLDGHVTETTERVRLDKIKRKTVTLEIEDADGTTREAVCKISKGKVASLAVEGDDIRMVAKDDAETGGN